MIAAPPRPACRGATAPRTLLSRNPGKIFAALLGHGLGAAYAWEVLRFAQEHGDAQSARVRLAFDGETWLVDLFPVWREEAA